MEAQYKFIIDTNKYAGNFEREMCAYLTGRIGECGVGKEYAKKFNRDCVDTSFDNIIEIPNEDGCVRPCEIEPHPGYFNTGRGNQYSYKNKPDDSIILADYAESVTKDCQQEIDSYQRIVEKLEAGEKYSNWTIKAAKAEIKDRKKKIENAHNVTIYYQYQAYNSVAIFFESKPSQEQIDLMKKRANQFQTAKRDSKNSWDKDFELEIEGFRLIKITTTEKEIKI